MILKTPEGKYRTLTFPHMRGDDPLMLFGMKGLEVSFSPYTPEDFPHPSLPKRRLTIHFKLLGRNKKKGKGFVLSPFLAL